MYKTLAIIGIVLITLSFTFHIIFPKEVTLSDCILLLSLYEPELKKAEMNEIKMENMKVISASINDKDFVATILNNKLSDCTLISKNVINFNPYTIYSCDDGKYFYDKGENNGFYFINMRVQNNDNFTRIMLISKNSKTKFDLITKGIEHHFEWCKKA